jgi:hypothetical protein
LSEELGKEHGMRDLMEQLEREHGIVALLVE